MKEKYYLVNYMFSGILCRIIITSNNIEEAMSKFYKIQPEVKQKEGLGFNYGVDLVEEIDL
jgi:hypothetical protein